MATRKKAPTKKGAPPKKTKGRARRLTKVPGKDFGSLGVLESLALLHRDDDLYLRCNINSVNVTRLKEAFLSDVPIPALVADRKSKKLIDGYHRQDALVQLYGSDAQWYVQWEDHETPEKRFQRACILNAAHGLPLSQLDLARIRVIGEKLGFTASDIAANLNMREITFDRATKGRFEKNSGENRLRKVDGRLRKPLKRAFPHLANQKLTEQQREVNDRAIGLPLWFQADRLREAIEAKMIDWDHKPTLHSFQLLHEALDTALAATN